MQEEFTIEFKKNISYISIYRDELIEKIIKKILRDKDILLMFKKEQNNNFYYAYKDDKKIYCICNLDLIGDDVYCLNIDMHNHFYSYYIYNKYNKLEIKLAKESYLKDNKEYELQYGNCFVKGEVKDTNNKINVDIKEKIINKKEYKDFLENIDLSISLENLYNLVNDSFTKCNDVKIIKSKITNNGYYLVNLDITDCIEIIDNHLKDYKKTINLQGDKSIIIEQQYNNKNIKAKNCTYKDIIDAYLLTLKYIKFAEELNEKLETEGKKLTKKR